VKQPQAERRTLATGLGEQYRATLGDGSLVELNTATRLAVDLAPEERRVVLASGEAVFDVAKDPERPFIVETKLASVRAVGTTFSVRIDRGLEVLVSEGVVIVDRDGQPLARVGAGERYSVAASGGAHTKAEPPDEIGRALVWREGKVAFAGETVLEAALELNRYNKVKIEVRDPAVGAMRLGGYFRATDPEGFATAMEQALPVDAHREGETITLSAR
jgi:transmembrane sensor